MTTECRCGHTLGWHDAVRFKDGQAGVCSIWACYCETYEVAK